MTHSLKERFEYLLGFGLAAIALIVTVFAVFGLAIHDWITRRRKNVPMDAYGDPASHGSLSKHPYL